MKKSPSLISFLVIASSLQLHAASDIWDGSNSASWADSSNWVTNLTVPGTGNIATFNDAGNGNTTIDLGAGVTIGSVVFDTSSAASHTLGSGAVGSQTLSFDNAGGITLNAAVTNSQLINANVSLSSAASAATTFTNNSSGLLTIAGTLNANVASGNGVLTVGGSGNTNISGAITKTGAGSNALLKTGAGTLTLSNGSTWTGSGAIGRVPATSAGYPLVAREGTLLLNGGTHTVNGEAVIGGVVADGGVGQNAKIQIDSGSLAVTSWLSIGRGNGTGSVSSDLVANNAATITAANFSAGFNGGNASNLPKGVTTLNNTSVFTISGNGAFNLAESTGSNMTITLNNASQLIASGTGIKYIGQGATGVMNINGTSSVTFGNAFTYVGYQAGNGTLNLNGGTFNNTGEVRVGGSATNGTGPNGTGNFNISGGIATVGGLTVARGQNNLNTVSGNVTVSGGTLNSVNDLVLGYAGNNNLGKLTISGGTVNVGTAATKWLQVGVWDTSKGQIDITSGALNLLNNTQIKMNAQGTIGANVINQSGGSVNFYSDAGTTIGGSGHLDMQRLGAASSNNTYNLNGGTLTVPQIISSVTTGTRTFNFNGGTLKAATSTTAFVNLGAGSARANIRNGGAIIDTNGLNVTISQPLLNSNIGADNATDGGLTKQSAGVLTLSGANTYNGTTNVNGGALALTGTLTSNIAVASGATITGTGSTTGSLTMATGSVFAANTSGAAFTANGVTFSGPATLIYNGATTNGSTYDLFFYGAGGVTGLSNLSSTFRTTLNDTGTKVTGTVQTGNLTWASTNGAWALGGSNWAGGFANYYDGDSVTFGNTGNTSTISITGSLIPTAVAVDSDDSYVFSGSGAIAGATTLTKSGTGSITINNSNSYSGGSTINSGTVTLGAAAALGNGTVALNGGTLDLNGQSIANAVAMGGGALSSAGSISGVVSGTTLAKSDAGKLTLSGAANTVDNINVTAGTLSISNGGALGDVMNNLDGGTLETTNNVALIIARPITVGAAGAAVNIVGGATTAQGSRVMMGGTNLLQGSGNLTISGSGALATDGGQGVFVVTGSNSFDGNVNLVNGGMFEYDNASAVAATATFTLGNNSEISATNGKTVGNAITVNGTGAVLSFNNNGAGIFSGAVTLNSDVSVALRNWWNYAGAQNGTISGAISGSGGIATNRGTSTGTPSLTLTGVNTYAGATNIAGGTTLTLGLAGQLGSGSYANNIINDGTLNQNSTADQSYSGTISGSGAVSQTGSGTTTITGNSNSYTGATTVSAGKLVVNGNISTSVLTTVSGTGTLGGSGSVGDLTVAAGGNITPGNSPGILNAGDTNLGSGSTLSIEINGDTVGSGYDQLNATGTVTLAGMLDLSLSYSPVENSLYFILANDDTDAITGTFDGLANESWFAVGAQLFRISYFGDSGADSFTGGNDIVLMSVPEPTVALLSGLGMLALLRRRRN